MIKRMLRALHKSFPVTPCLICFLSLLFSIFLTGCGGNDHLGDLRKYVDETKKNSELSIPDKPRQNLPPMQPVIFKADATRTPFQLNSDDSGTQKNPTSPINAFPLSILKFVGTASEGDETTAYILTPNNMIFQVRKGDSIGEHDGKIIDIRPSVLEVQEQNTDDDSKGPRIVELELKDNN